MPTVTTKPIRPTRVNFNSSEEKKRFIEYADQSKRTESLDMDRIREMVKNHKDKRK